MRTLTTTIAVLRTLRGELAIIAAIAAIAAVVAFSTFVVSAIPQLQQEIFGRELSHRVAGAPPDWRNFSTRVTGSPSIRGDATIIERLETAGDSYLASLDPVLQSIISTHHYVLQSPTGNVVQMRYQPLYPFQRSLTQRVQSGTEQQITLIGGRMPQPRGPVLQSEIVAKPGARGERPVRQREVLLSATTAQDLGLELNDWLLTEPEGPPVLDGPPERLLIHVVGLFTVNDPEAG